MCVWNKNEENAYAKKKGVVGSGKRCLVEPHMGGRVGSSVAYSRFPAIDAI